MSKSILEMFKGKEVDFIDIVGEFPATKLAIIFTDGATLAIEANGYEDAYLDVFANVHYKGLLEI